MDGHALLNLSCHYFLNDDYRRITKMTSFSKGFTEVFDKKLQRRVLRRLIGAIALDVGPCDEVNNLRDWALWLVDNLNAINVRDFLSWKYHGDNFKVASAFASFSALFSKRADLDFGIDRRAVALETFWLTENQCRQVNADLRSDAFDRNDRAALIFKMQRKIAQILGPCPTVDQLDFGFGPGSNNGCSKHTSVRQKLAADLTSTVQCLSLFEGSHGNSHAWPGLKNVRLVRGSRFDTVPKSWKTDRCINVEPILNSYVQKGIGSAIRRRLLRCGVDLTDQTRNASLARYGSIAGSVCSKGLSLSGDELATIDLSNASDTIAAFLVLDLLPIDWFHLLYASRSHECCVDGQWVELEKFSSMGNGYTFELESLIFYALLAVSTDGIISVYGDDMVCPSDDAPVVIRNLQLLGFTVNVDKSFVHGSFKESCGKDYFGGIDIRPVYLKTSLSVAALYRLYNRFRSKGFRSSAAVLLQHIPTEYRFFGPDAAGDAVLHCDDVQFTPDKRGWTSFWRGRGFTPIPLVVEDITGGEYGAVLLRAGTSLEPTSPMKFKLKELNSLFYFSDVSVFTERRKAAQTVPHRLSYITIRTD